MVSKKDMRRPDLAVPYQEPAAKSSETPEMSSTLSSTLPMAAIFTRNRYIGWASVVFSLQSWLGESDETTKTSSTPGYFTVGMSVMALAVTYLPMFLPPQAGGQQRAATGTGAPPPAPPS
ncbi:Uu.00g117490.m01.CDS01 [Anthostomella pinea]|uniref:Uu.00g117490.m01.CDS01 n=1 Tax=Anthostomella pinea TaxID=933095 RepID=A0AAI8VG91_9PEZI|nr:Uu.00g117490.m01.CDS01 [Anthostomella pinea]